MTKTPTTKPRWTRDRPAAIAAVVALVCASAVAGTATALAQTNRAPSATAPALPSTIAPTITEAPAAAPRPKPPAHTRRRHKAPRKTPNWVVQSNAQLALEADPRFKNVHASMTQPGVIVLEGGVFDDAAKAAAEQTVAAVQGVTRVINTLTTETLKWLLLQNRINQSLQQNGLTLVTVKLVGKTAFLNGQVSSDADKDKAVAVVKSASPDISIGSNLINVKPSMF